MSAVILQFPVKTVNKSSRLLASESYIDDKKSEYKKSAQIIVFDCVRVEYYDTITHQAKFELRESM